MIKLIGIQGVVCAEFRCLGSGIQDLQQQFGFSQAPGTYEVQYRVVFTPPAMSAVVIFHP
ncbi:hypothetical protein X777_02825 [Ooceraea biroi]|uniref:Uncharacterized protein n=1 Tax=Ooceraea biroi TaxID=2015173 RepID=A0A026X489_OOCBI|nr:hypothetical protein X777_02825 [Ooceraea biroi]